VQIKHLVGYPAVAVIAIVIGSASAGSGAEPAATSAPAVDSPAGQEPAVVAKKAPKTYGEGTYEVGVDIKAGKYKTSGGTNCYFARLSSLDGGDIIDNNLSDGPMIASIKKTDKAIEFSGECSWVAAK
jgi:hypothetical protein